jgi:hypothetical protein
MSWVKQQARQQKLAELPDFSGSSPRQESDSRISDSLLEFEKSQSDIPSSVWMDSMIFGSDCWIAGDNSIVIGWISAMEQLHRRRKGFSLKLTNGMNANPFVSHQHIADAKHKCWSRCDFVVVH